jgi:hypothetical protein
MPSANLERVFSFLMPLMPMAGGKSLREAPVILSESMIFPYLRGLVFCARLTNDNGWTALNEAYRRPPLSTEQILHPEKYAAQPDPPTAVDLGKLDVGHGWKDVVRNVVGEMQLAVMLRRHGGKKAAAGWDGDQFAAFEATDGRLGLVWFSTWDSETDADEFLRAYTAFQASKIADSVPGLAGGDKNARRPAKGAIYSVERRGVDVVVVEGFPLDLTETLRESAFRARKTEKTHPTVKPTKGADEK